MSDFIATLPMYDWPEVRADVDAQWVGIRDRLRASGIDAPEALTREDDLHAMWVRPNLLIGQTCWGPMECGLAPHVQVVAQANYDGVEGGRGEDYSSAIVRRREPGEGRAGVPPRGDGKAALPLDFLRGKRFAYNNPDSMSGLLGITRDLEAAGESIAIFSERIETGAHRESIQAIAEGRADVASIDCRSWALAKRFEAAAEALVVVGWTALRKGQPMITAKTTPPEIVAKLRSILA
jgi:ABC-type phosphate/phosphonate transport system substrate-binding protein